MLDWWFVSIAIWNGWADGRRCPMWEYGKKNSI